LWHLSRQNPFSLVQKMMALIAQDACTLAQASQQVLGFNLDVLAETVLEAWNISR
jgi:hypothetical protein